MSEMQNLGMVRTAIERNRLSPAERNSPERIAAWIDVVSPSMAGNARVSEAVSEVILNHLLLSVRVSDPVLAQALSVCRTRLTIPLRMSNRGFFRIAVPPPQPNQPATMSEAVPPDVATVRQKAMELETRFTANSQNPEEQARIAKELAGWLNLIRENEQHLGNPARVPPGRGSMERQREGWAKVRESILQNARSVMRNLEMESTPNPGAWRVRIGVTRVGAPAPNPVRGPRLR